MNAYRGYGTRVPTKQTERIPGREDQVKNNAGGYVFALDKWAALDRFLILGTEGGTYYQEEQTLTRENADNLMACIQENGTQVVHHITNISHAGRALKNDPAIFALAACFGTGDEATKKAARDALPLVCRIGTHIFHFAQYVEQFRGWGRALKNAVAAWYDGKNYDSLAVDVIKYRQRDGWGHDDLIRLSHPKNFSNGIIYDWVLGKERAGREDPRQTELSLPPIIEAFEKAQDGNTSHKDLERLIRENRLPREALPTEALKHKGTWAALLEDMPIEAMVRNLGNMGSVGLLEPLSNASRKVVAVLQDDARITSSRLHPLRILAASMIYERGRGFRGDNTWVPVSQVIDALNEAFYKSFQNIEPTGKKTLLGLDVSGSMHSSHIAAMPYMSCREATAALALVTARTEQEYFFGGFSNGFTPLAITAQSRLADAMRVVSNLPFQSTDCALPITWAMEKKLDFETFVIYTDNETYEGPIHVNQALARYRQQVGHDVKVAVVGMTASKFSIADPRDANMMDFVGFDTETPAAIAEFSR